MTNFSKEISEKIKLLPEEPGVYQFFNANDKIIYIGKAKNLKRRVSSYFQKKVHDSYKVKILVDKVVRIEHIVVDSESDALLLENNLIKKYQPKYNILLKDDKTFPWICIKNEPFPRVFLTRNIVKDGSKYYGPYTSTYMVRTLLDLIRQLYQLRTCKHTLSQENIAQGKFKLCLEYHIKNCQGPCEGLQESKAYDESIREIHEILKGNLHGVISILKTKMKSFADNFQFEEAEKLKQKIEIIGNFQSKSTIVNPSINNVDVFSIVEEEKYAIVNYLRIMKGSVIQVHTVELQKQLDESTSEILRFAVLDLRERIRSDSKEVVLPIDLSDDLSWLKITVPKKGDKKKLLELSERNARIYKLEKQKRASTAPKIYPAQRIVKKLQSDLQLDFLPERIECFDNSNIQGSNPVASCVVFRNAKPAKKEYRHYHIKTVVGPDDFASMEEVIYRRYRRLLEEKSELPQLIIVDGGKGQLTSALKSLDRLKLRNKIAIIGIAKRLEEIYFPDDPIPIYIDKNSESLKLIQNLRNEAHRFGIEFHRLLRSNSMLTSELESIDGIGKKSIEKLFLQFKSIEGIKLASEDDLLKVIDRRKINLLRDYFSKK